MLIARADRDGVAIAVLEHGRANALDVELLDALTAELAGEPVRPTVLTGSGSIFCAGVDLRRVLAEGPGYIDRLLVLFRKALHALFSFPAPLVVAANGHAIAGGCILLETGDVRLMARGKGRIGVPELLVGLPFPATALEVLRFILPAHVLQQLVVSGETLDPDAALGIGLVDGVVDDENLLDEAVARAARLGAIAPDVFRLTKWALRSDVIARLDASSTLDRGVSELWHDPATRRRIEAYMAALENRK